MNQIPSCTTSYKFYYNQSICFVASAKLGTRFFKKFITNEGWDSHSYPLNTPFNQLEYDNQEYWKPDYDGYFNYLKETLITNVDTMAFLIRHPYDRFCSGISTLLDIYNLRFFKYEENGIEFLKTNFPNNLSDEEIKIKAEEFKKLIGEFYTTKNPDILKQIIFDYIITETIYKDAHVEHHHTLLYSFMNRCKEYNQNLKWLDLTNLDDYITKKATIDTKDEEHTFSKNSSKTSLPYDIVKNNISAWKYENNNLSSYLHIESENYEKIKAEYEVLL
jgi:hypothetical protein